MKKKLLDVLCMSEKRKQVMILLSDGAKEMEYLLRSIDTTRQALLPQVKILEQHHLVRHYEDTYELTQIGKLIVDEMRPLLETIEVLDTDVAYWGELNLDFIPAHMLKRVGDLGECRIKIPHITEVFEINREFHEASKVSRYHYTVTTLFHSNFPSLVFELINNNVEMYFIISGDLFEKLKKQKYEDLSKLLQSDLVHFFVYPDEMKFQCISYNDSYIILNLLKNNDEPETKSMLCKGKNAIQWGKDFFEHYMKISTPIDEL